LIFERKNWPNDLRFDCKPFSNLIELIEKDLDFEDDVENFEDSLERDEFLDL
jgi:hypothetical protein